MECEEGKHGVVEGRSIGMRCWLQAVEEIVFKKIGMFYMKMRGGALSLKS